FSADDLRRQLEQASPGITFGHSDAGLQNLLSNMAISAQNSLLEGCSIFIDRLRASPGLAQKLKELMQNWGKEE
ncbi:MAG: hypothetical protein Q8O16_02365, partial [Dehalococcoidia bacterium]|nr:hypothetical protein [Dehalococcoidia bacterium]